MQLKTAKHFALHHAGLLVVLGILTLIFGLGTDSFFRFQTLGVIANQIPDLTLVAVGMTLCSSFVGLIFLWVQHSLYLQQPWDHY